MQRVVLDRETLAKLGGAERVVELCDENGETVGIFSPVAATGGLLYDDLEIPVTEEEARELAKQPRGRPLAEILAELERSA